MEIYNAAARAVDDDPDMKMYDEHVKRLLAVKIFLAHILKNCLDEFKDFEPEEIAEKFIEGTPVVSETAVHRDEGGDKAKNKDGVPKDESSTKPKNKGEAPKDEGSAEPKDTDEARREQGGTKPKSKADELITGMNTVDTSIDERTVTYDILFYAFVPKLNETVKFIINIEAQQKFYPGYSLLKRAVYYCSRLISAQYKKEFGDLDYDSIKKVFSIWICPDPPVGKRNTVTRFSMCEKSLIGNASFKHQDYDLLEIIMVCLGGSEGDENYKGVIRLLDRLTSPGITVEGLRKFLKNEYNIKMTTEISREVLGMCNLSYGLLEKGRAKGKAEGLFEAFVSGVKALMDGGKYTFDGAFEALKIPGEYYNSIKEIVLG